MAESNSKWNGKSRGNRAGYLIFVYLIRYAGLTSAYVILAFVIAYYVLFAPGQVKAIWNFHHKHLGEGRLCSAVNVYRHFYNFGMALIDRLAIKGGMADRYEFEYENFEQMEQFISNGKGAVFIGAHMGSWEVGSMFFGKYGKKINVVKYDAERKEVKEVIQQHTEAEPYKSIYMTDDPVGAMIQVKAALNNGEYICFDADRYTNLATAREIPFLGGKAFFPSGPFKVAYKCKVPVVFFYALREKGRKFRFIFEIMDDKEADLGGMMQRFTDSLEDKIARYPLQWYNFYEFWSTQDHEK